MGRKPLEEQDRIDKDKIPSAINALKELKPKELPDVSTREAIRQMKRYIDGALKKHYTYDEISDVLYGLDIHISGSRLKYLLSEIKKNTRTRKKNKTSQLEETATFEVNGNSVNPDDAESTPSYGLISNGSARNKEKRVAVKSTKVKAQSVKSSQGQTIKSSQGQSVKSSRSSSKVKGDAHTNEPQVYDDDDL